MRANKAWFVSPAGRGTDLDLASDEPSHIHIARPSRLLRRDNSPSSVEPTDQVRDLAATEVSVQATRSWSAAPPKVDSRTLIVLGGTTR